MLNIFYTVCRQAGENDMTADAMQRLFLNMETLVKEYRESANAELRDLGLRSAEILCLQTLMYHPDGLSVIELAGASERDKAQISRTMKSLNSRGYVQENPADAARQRKVRAESHLVHAGKECRDLGTVQGPAAVMKDRTRFVSGKSPVSCLRAVV